MKIELRTTRKELVEGVIKVAAAVVLLVFTIAISDYARIEMRNKVFWGSSTEWSFVESLERWSLFGLDW